MKSTRKQILVVFFLLTSVGVFAAAAHAQVATAVLLGTVEDASGGAVVGASVDLKSTTTGVSITTITGSDGSYVFPQAPVGRYSLEVKMTGFRRFERTGIILNVNQKARIDVRLEVGEVTQTVNVDANAALVNTVDGEVGQVVNQKNIVELPLKGRQFLELAFLTTGAVNAPNDYRATQQGIAPAVNGNRPEANSYTLNGASNMEPFDGQFTIVPSVDSVEEFKIQSGSFNAEYGQAGGAIVNVITKSGTNSFHGSLYEFFRNDKLNARNFFNPIKSPVRQNQYGGTIGGPILKNKTFFFFNYEGFKERRAGTRSSRFPTPTLLSGDFSAESIMVKDPATGVPFPGNMIPAERIDPVAKKYITYIPKPQSGLSGAINFINNQPGTVDNFTMGWRVDHQLSPKDKLSGVVNWMDFDNLAPASIPNGPGAFANPFFNKMVNITHTRTFSPTSVNEARLSYTRFNNPQTNPPTAEFPNRDYATELGLTGLTTEPFIRNRFPGITFGQGWTGIPRSVEYMEILNRYQFQDNFSWVKPRHTMKFGVGYNQSRMKQAGITNAPITYDFTGRFSGHSVADFLLGIAESTTTFLSGGISYLLNSQYHFYAQDQWQVGKDFTLNYGVRWEIHTPWREIRGQMSSLNTKTGAMIFASDAPPIVDDFGTQANVPIERLSKRTLYDTKYCCAGPLMPRFGFAWVLPHMRSTVLRGGYAMSQNTEIGNLLNSPLAAPFWIRIGITEQVYPGIGFNTRRASLANLAATPITLQALLPLPGWEEGYVQSWSLTLEKQLQSGILLSGAYVGSKGTHLSTLGNINEAPPGPGSIQPRRPFPRFVGPAFENYGASNYHSLQLKAEKQFDTGLGFLMGYTYSKGLSNTSTLNEGPRALSALDRRTARGRIGFDIRQRYTAAVIYELPFGKNQPFLNNVAGWVDSILGGWQVNTITAIQTGYPINIGVSPCLINGAAGRCVPNTTGPNHGNLPRGERDVNRWFNTGSFSAPPPFTQGNAQQWTLDGPTGLNNWDTSFVKNTSIREGWNLQFRAEFFNLFNHTRFNGVSTTLGASNFGRITSTTGEREIQFALKLLF